MYLVRHGSTDAHSHGIKQSPTTPLSKAGVKQVEDTADWLKKFHTEYLYSSEWKRAEQTAQIIAERLGIMCSLRPDVHECSKNPILNGLAADDPLVLQSYQEYRENIDDADWKFMGDGESVNETIERARKYLDDMAAKHPTNSVVVATHNLFIGVIVSLILLWDDYNHKTFMNLKKQLRMDNAGITVIEYSQPTGKWTLKSFNVIP